MRRILSFAMLSMALLSGNVHAADSVSFKTQKCPFTIPSGERAVCGYLTVPESRSKNTTKNISLFVAIVKSYSREARRDPIVYLTGEPDFSASSRLSEGLYWQKITRFHQDRDIILIDQRGYGLSTPSILCPDVPEKYLVSKADYRLSLQQCRDRLRQEKIDINAFNSKESAQDVIALMRQLNIKRWNLLATSTASRVAMAMMSIKPSSVRSVVLNSPVTMLLDKKASDTLAANNQRVFKQFFYDCGVDPICRKSYPNLQDVYLQLVRSLPNNIEPGKPSVPFVVNKLSMNLAYPDTVSVLPGQIYQLAQANSKGELGLARFNRIMNILQTGSHSLPGVTVSYFCSDLGVYAAKSPKTKPVTSSYFIDDNEYAYQIWGAGDALKVFENSTYQNIPVMVFAGEYDTLVPLAWSRSVAKSLPNAKLFQFKGVGHDVVGHLACAVYMAAAFFDRPDHKPEDVCMSALSAPQFEPGT